MAFPIPAWLDRWIAGEVPLRELAADRLALPSGRVVACDPMAPLESARPFAREVPPGRYAVKLGTLEGDVALASVRFGRARVASWEPALIDGADDEEVPGYPARSGVGCFADASALGVHLAEERARYQSVAKAFREEGVDPDDLDAWDEAFEERLEKDAPDPLAGVATSIEKKGFGSVVLDAESKGNLVAFKAGIGEGIHASYWGLDAKGRPMMLVTDFGLVEPTEDERDRQAAEDEDELDDIDIAELEAWLQSRVAQVPEPPPAVSPLLPRAEAIVDRWVRSGKMQLEEDCDRGAFAEALLEKLVTLEGHRHLGPHLAEWLMERPEVADVFASDDELEADLRER